LLLIVNRSNEGLDVKVKKVQWNKQYQQLLQMEDSYQKFHLIGQLAKDFNYTATVYGT